MSVERTEQRLTEAVTDGLTENWQLYSADPRLVVVERTDGEHYLTVRAATREAPVEYDLTLMDGYDGHAIPIERRHDTIAGVAAKVADLVEHSEEFAPLLTDDDAPRYTRIDPRCPNCGTTKHLEPSGEGGDSMDAHFIDYYCAGCDAYLTVELAAIDVLVRDETGDVVKSGVSSGDIIPRTHEYPDPANYE